MHAKALILMLLAWAHVAQAGSLSDPLAGFGVLEPKVRMMAPDFSLQGLDGEKHQLSDYRGQLVILHFWATWCAPCRHEMPVLYALDQTLAGKGMVFLFVNVDRGNSDEVESFTQTVGQSFHTLLDASGDVRNSYAVRALPTTYIIGRDGKFSGLIVGARDWSKAMPMLSVLLKLQ